MENIIPKTSSNLSKMWNKILNLENSLFPKLQENLRIEEFSSKESNLIKSLDFFGHYHLNKSEMDFPFH